MISGRIQERLTTLLGLDPDALSRIGLESAVRRRMRAIDVAAGSVRTLVGQLGWFDYSIGLNERIARGEILS